MGARGPAPLPTKILEARGSPLAKERAGEPDLPVESPTCPAWLSKEGKAEWKRQVKALKAMRVVAQCDRALLAAWCETWAEWVMLGEEVATHPGGYAAAIAAGLVGARSKAADRLIKLAQQFGFSPSARTRLKSPPATSNDDDSVRLFNGSALG